MPSPDKKQPRDFNALYHSKFKGLAQRTNISYQANEAFYALDNELNRTPEENVEQRLRIWVGGIIIAMIQDDNNYRFRSSDKRAYPCLDEIHEINQRWKALPAATRPSQFYYIGDAALKDATLFNGDMFKRSIQWWPAGGMNPNPPNQPILQPLADVAGEIDAVLRRACPARGLVAASNAATNSVASSVASSVATFFSGWVGASTAATSQPAQDPTGPSGP